jgi:hypothetical protein
MIYDFLVLIWIQRSHLVKISTVNSCYSNPMRGGIFKLKNRYIFQIIKEDDFNFFFHLKAFFHLKKINLKVLFKNIFKIVTFFQFENTLPHEVINQDLLILNKKKLIYIKINHNYIFTLFVL